MMNTLKITFRLLLVAILLGGMMVGAASFAMEEPEEEKGKRISKAGAYLPTRYQILNINNLWSWMREDGLSNHSALDRDGVSFPRGTGFIIYEDGIVWGTKAYLDAAHTIPAPFDQVIRAGGSTYGIGTRDGWINGLGATAARVPIDDPDSRIWRIRRDWLEMDDAAILQDAGDSYEKDTDDVSDGDIQNILDDYQYCWDNWNIEHGAPFIDRNGDGVFTQPPAFNIVKDADGNLLPDDPAYFGPEDLILEGHDEPGLAGIDVDSPADQVIWTVYNDLWRSMYLGSEPTGLEVQVTLWGYKRTDALGNIFFRRIKFLNKGGVAINTDLDIGAFYLDSMYMCQWSDPDLGQSGDDLLGCDTVLSIGYVYNGNAEDLRYRDFGLPPPSAGYDFLAGPAVPSPGDRAVFDMKYKNDFKNMPMTGFSYFSAGSPYSDPSQTTYETGAIRWYKMHRGFAPLGTSASPDERYRHPPGVEAGPFPLAGDPVAGTGHIDGLGEEWSFVCGDRRLLCITGPWSMAPGDTQEVTVALVCGLGGDRFSSISVMKFNDRFAQDTYDALFQVPKAPKAPIVSITSSDGEVFMNWGNNLAGIADTEGRVNEPGSYVFEGYNVYQFPKEGSTLEDAKRIATYDVANTSGVVMDQGFDPVSGRILPMAVQFGTNAGVKRTFMFDHDYVNDISKINNGTEYYLAVTAYSVTTIPGFMPASLESEVKVQVVTSQVPFGIEVTTTTNDTIPAVHSAGASNGMAYPVIMDPQKLNGHDYEVTFTDVDGDGNTEFNLMDLTANTMLIEGGTNQTGDENYFLTDGFQLRVVGAPNDFVNFLAVANANGVLDPPEIACFGFNSSGFPLYMGNDRPGDRQQVGAGKWGFHTGGNRTTYAQFISRTTRDGANWGGIIPWDFEMRFTPLGCYSIRWFDDDVIVHVPFELWNTGMGTPDDPSDDYQLIPYLLENDDNLAYSISGDHPISGGDNDPYADWIYWAGPADISAGTAGYDAYVAQLDLTTMNNVSFGGGTELLARTVLVNWNGGSAPPYNQDLPEEGTIFRILTTKPNTVNDKFTFTSTAPAETPELAKKSAEDVGVFPNPYYAFNALETYKLDRFVVFNNLPQRATIRIFNLAGHLIRKIEKEDDTQFCRWNLLSGTMMAVASGMYICHIDMPDIDAVKILKLAVVLEAEVLDTY